MAAFPQANDKLRPASRAYLGAYPRHTVKSWAQKERAIIQLPSDDGSSGALGCSHRSTMTGHPRFGGEADIGGPGGRPPGRYRDHGKMSEAHRTYVGEEGFEPSHPFGHTDLNRARLPFRHSPE